MAADGITLALLRERFVTRLDQRLSHLTERLGVLCSPSTADQAASALDDMMRGFHSLAGIGGTFGFAHITDLASIGEVACQTMKLPVSAEDTQMLAGLVDSLRLTASARARVPSIAAQDGAVRARGDATSTVTD